MKAGALGRSALEVGERLGVVLVRAVGEVEARHAHARLQERNELAHLPVGCRVRDGKLGGKGGGGGGANAGQMRDARGWVRTAGRCPAQGHKGLQALTAGTDARSHGRADGRTDGRAGGRMERVVAGGRMELVETTHVSSAEFAAALAAGEGVGGGPWGATARARWRRSSRVGCAPDGAGTPKNVQGSGAEQSEQANLKCGRSERAAGVPCEKMGRGCR